MNASITSKATESFSEYRVHFEEISLESKSPGPTGSVFNIMRFALNDGPGIRTTVFMKGCPLKCWWCHNPESQSRQVELTFFPERCIRCGECIIACPHGALHMEGHPVRDVSVCQHCGSCAEACACGAHQIVGRRMSVEEVMKVILRDVVFYDESSGGVTFSGGEPLLQPEFLEEVLDRCAEQRLHKTVDTCAIASSETVDRISPKVDLWLVDLKVADPARHRQLTGMDNGVILANLETLVRRGASVIVRIPIVPTVNDDEENIRDSIELLARIGVRRLDLLPYHQTGSGKYDALQRPYRLDDLRPPSAERMEEIADRFKNKGFDVHLGG
jgi:pyruvate formate lyase activating enzyme